ncbi:MAG: GntR family transcriptional regulator [Cyclobacteriaceae bacterium]
MDFDNNKNIYLQLADNISESVLQKRHNPGDRIPSVREFAAEVGVNPNTVMRTYSELQNQGIIENKRGIGYFVTESAPEIILKQKKELFFQQELPHFHKKLKLLDIDFPTLKLHIESLNGKQNESK